MLREYMQGECSLRGYFLQNILEAIIESMLWGRYVQKKCSPVECFLLPILEAIFGSTRRGSTCKGSVRQESASYHLFWRPPLGVRAEEMRARIVLLTVECRRLALEIAF